MLNTTGSGLGARKAIAPRSIESMARRSRDGRSSAVIKAREAGVGREPH